MKIEKWDIVIYDIGNGIEEGVVIAITDDGGIRTDTDGMVGEDAIMYVVPGAGIQNVYDSSFYQKEDSYRAWMRQFYKLPIPAKYKDTKAQRRRYG